MSAVNPPGFPISDMVVGSNGAIVAANGPGPLLLSSDEGNTWSAGANFSTFTNQVLAISPADPNIVYIAFNSAVYKSNDGGKTFAKLFAASMPGQYKLVIDVGNPSILSLATYSAVYQSTDAGQTWAQLSLPYPVLVNSVFISPTNSALILGANVESGVFVTKWSPDGSQILYSTYFGGGGNNSASAIAVDASGSAYITGSANSSDFPTTPGADRAISTSGGSSIFVAKLSPDGSKLVYSALIQSKSNANAIIVDSQGEAVITGSTQDSNYPVTPGAFQTTLVATCGITNSLLFFTGPSAAFITMLSASGSSLVYSTFLGGSCATYGNNLALDANGNAWVVGSTISPDFPVTSDALQSKYGGGEEDGDGFLARFNPSGGLDYASYIGGPGYDQLTAIAFDQSGNLYLTGESAGLSQPSSPNAYQPKASASCFAISIGPSFYEPAGNGLVLKLDPQAHNVLGLTYLGALGCLIPSAIAVDSKDQPWIAGMINPAGYTLPTVSPLELGGLYFISKFSADLTQLSF